jgi:hypothetical protein
MVKQVRAHWNREQSSPQPNLDALDGGYPEATLLDASPGKPVTEDDRRYMLRVLQTLLIVVVVGQRITIPFGSAPIGLPLVAVFVGIFLMRLRGGVRYNRVRTELYLASAGVLVACTWLTGWLHNDISLNSLLLLLVMYLPWVFCISTQYSDLFLPLMKTFVRLMIGAAIVGSGQMLAQLLLHWTYSDLVLGWVPKTFLAQNYNTANQISYTNHTVKANAFVFLEPSFLCQFCALALLVSLLIRAPAWQSLLLGLGMASTLSGTGIILLVIGIAIMVVRAPNRIRPNYVLAGVVGLAVIFSTPVADILLARSNETSQQNSSGSERFVQPYTEVGDGLAKQPDRYLVGAGAGSSDRLLTSDRSGGAAVVYVIAPKVAFEYGLVAMFIFVSFLLVSIYRGPPVPVLATAVAVMIFFLSGSLLQPHTIMLAWLLTSLWGPPVTVGVSDALAAVMRRESAPAL